jgi:hypothetical protein
VLSAVERAVRTWTVLYSLTEAEAELLRWAALGDGSAIGRARAKAVLRRTADTSFFETTTRLLRDAVATAGRTTRRRREDTLEGRIEELREIAEQPRSDATRYAIGAIINELKRHPERYGKNAVSAAASAIGEDIPGLYRFATVAERWIADEAMALLKPRRGRRLLWSHLVAVAPVTSAAVRRGLLRRALRERLSVRQLADVLTSR